MTRLSKAMLDEAWERTMSFPYRGKEKHGAQAILCYLYGRIGRYPPITSK
jgi:hypothetical protein